MPAKNFNLMNFSFVLIARNEEKTLPRLLSSLEEFKSRGGKVYLLDTGSTDKTVQVAKDWGVITEEVGDKFVIKIDDDLANKINTKFEGKIVKVGEKIFDYASARNYASKMSDVDFIFTPDCDEIFTKLDLDVIEQLINSGVEQFEYQFVYSHDKNGNELLKLRHSKAYDRRKLSWRGVVHEVLFGNANKKYLEENIIKLEHYQNEATNRSHYLTGLAIDCYNNPSNDRNSHYFARELKGRGFINSAIKEFKHHLTIGTWDAERAKSMIFIGECLIQQGKDKEALEWYHKAYIECDATREPLIKLGKYFFDKKDWKRCIFYLEGCLNIKYSGFYYDDLNHYRDYPLSMLYVAYWWLGDKEKSKEYYNKALLLNPNDKGILKDSEFYYDKFEYQDKGIPGWMTAVELDFLFKQAKKVDSVLEVGSWKGRSTHALLSGCKGVVTAVDHFEGSADKADATNKIGKDEDVLSQFKKNVGDFTNLSVCQMSSSQAETLLKNEMFDMVFIDAEHTYEGVKKDIELWKPHAKKILCGHDYQSGWPGVIKAVDEMIGKPDGVYGSIWYKLIK